MEHFFKHYLHAAFFFPLPFCIIFRGAWCYNIGRVGLYRYFPLPLNSFYLLIYNPPALISTFCGLAAVHAPPIRKHVLEYTLGPFATTGGVFAEYPYGAERFERSRLSSAALFPTRIKFQQRDYLLGLL